MKTNTQPNMTKVYQAVARIETREQCLEVLRELLHSLPSEQPAYYSASSPTSASLGNGAYRNRRTVMPIANSDY